MRSWLVLLFLLFAVAPAAAKPRHEALAEKVIAAIASGDVLNLKPLFSKQGWDELGAETRTNFRQLRKRLETEKIDLAKAKIVKVSETKGTVTMVEVVLEHGGRTFRTGFNVMTVGGSYDLAGIASWIK
jgi:hypothetical protein